MEERVMEMWIIIAVTIIAFGVWVGEVVLTPFPETKKKRSSQNEEDLWKKLAAMIQDNLPKKD